MRLMSVGALIVLIANLVPAIIQAQTIHHAARDGDIAAVRRLIQEDHRRVNAVDEGRFTPLHHAARRGFCEIVETLLASDADPNLLTREGASALHLAARHGQGDCVNLLLQHEVELNTGMMLTPTTAEYAARGAMVQLFQRLRDAGVDLEGRVQNGGTLLHAAAEGGSPRIVELLLDLELDVSETDRYGWTPLHYAAERGKEEVSLLLLERGADANAVSIGVRTPLSLTRTYGMHAEAQLLEEHGAIAVARTSGRVGRWFGEQAPGSEPRVFALDIVSSNRFEHGTVTFSPDGFEAFWETGFLYPPEGRIVTSHLGEAGWTQPEYVPFANDSAHGGDVPFFSPDGRKLFFISQRPVAGVDEGGVERVWVAERTDSGWGDPRVLDGGPNSIGLHWQFSVAANGNMYFGSGPPGGLGGADIYLSRFVDGVYQAPENLGAVINSEAFEFSPFIAPDESYLIVTGSRPDSRGGADLYISFMDPDGTWTPPQNLGDRINTPTDEICPRVSGDGRFLFWNSRTHGNTDNFWIDAAIIGELRARAFR